MSKFRTLVMFTVLAAVTFVLLLGVNRFEKRLDAQVAEHKLRFTGEIRNAPPMVIFTTVCCLPTFFLWVMLMSSFGLF